MQCAMGRLACAIHAKQPVVYDSIRCWPSLCSINKPFAGKNVQSWGQYNPYSHTAAHFSYLRLPEGGLQFGTVESCLAPAPRSAVCSGRTMHAAVSYCLRMLSMCLRLLTLAFVSTNSKRSIAKENLSTKPVKHLTGGHSNRSLIALPILPDCFFHQANQVFGLPLGTSEQLSPMTLATFSNASPTNSSCNKQQHTVQTLNL